jgi:hypothetical protein
MNETPTTDARKRSRLRWLTLGEAVAVAAVLISALGLWNSWRTGREGPAHVVEERAPIALSLRGQPDDDGERLVLTPVEESHAIDSMSVKVKGQAIEVGSDGRLSASDVESALGDAAATGKGTHRVLVEIATRYVEAGRDRRSSGSYVISYRWEDGGLFGGRSLRLTGFSRA